MEGVKTVSEIAQDLGTNRQKIWRIVRSLNIQERFKDGNKATIADEDVTRIRAEFLRINEKAERTRADRHTDNGERYTASRSDTTAAAILEERLKAKEELLTAKDEIIADLRRQLEEQQRQADKTQSTIENLQATNTKQLETINELTAAIKAAQDNQRGNILLMAANKPRLLDKIKAVFNHEE